MNLIKFYGEAPAEYGSPLAETEVSLKGIL